MNSGSIILLNKWNKIFCERARKKCLPGIFVLSFLEFHVHLAQRDRSPDLWVWLLIKKVNIPWNSATVLLWVISTKQIQVHGDHQTWEVAVTMKGSLKCWRNRLIRNSWNSTKSCTRDEITPGSTYSPRNSSAKQDLWTSRGTEVDCVPLEPWRPPAQELH